MPLVPGMPAAQSDGCSARSTACRQQPWMIAERRPGKTEASPAGSDTESNDDAGPKPPPGSTAMIA